MCLHYWCAPGIDCKGRMYRYCTFNLDLAGDQRR